MTKAKVVILPSFYNEENDSERAMACRMSKGHFSWHLVTLDGNKWEAYTMLPDAFVQAVTFQEGKRVQVHEGTLKAKQTKPEQADAVVVQTASPEQFVLISACRPEYSGVANHARSKALVQRLHGKVYTYELCVGAWQGKQEVSFMVPLPSDPLAMYDCICELSQLALEFQQDACLFVNKANEAYVVTQDASVQATTLDFIGHWMQASQEYARKQQGYTAVPVGDKMRYYVVGEM